MALFQEFDKSSYQAWLNQLQKELKGGDTSRLQHFQSEGLRLPTYLEAGDMSDSPSPLAYKVATQSTEGGANHWMACVELKTNDLVQCNRKAIRMLEHGASALRFTGLGISNQDELRLVLRNIQPEIICTHFDCGEANPSLLFMFLDELEKMGADKSLIRGSTGFDPLGDYALMAHLPASLEESMQIARSLLTVTEENLPAFKCISHNGSIWHHAGATMAEELAFSLAAIAEYMVHTREAEKVARYINLRIAIGADFFGNISKVRSLRLLWERMLRGFDLDAGEIPLWISAETSLLNLSLFDPLNNQLRITTEAMAAVIGGIDDLTIHPYNIVFNQSDDHAERIALNVHHILRYESHLDAVADAAHGSDYIEKYSAELGEAAWAIFLQVEEQGGYLKTLKSGWIQERIAATRSKKEAEFATGKRSLVGVNRFAKADEQLTPPEAGQRDPLARQPEIETIKPYREAAELEKIRIRISERSPKPKALLLLGNNKQRSGDRAAFSYGFMAMAGIEAITDHAGKSLEDQLKSEASQQAHLIILCADDEEYPEMVKTMQKSDWPECPVLIAGKPTEETQALKGIHDWIYLGCDALLTLQNLESVL